MSIKDLVTSYPALQEFGNMARAILPIMTDPNENRDSKRKALNNLANELSEKTFKNKIIAQQIMQIINMGEEVCEEYPDAESQVQGILSWIPRMELHRDILKKEVIKHRKSFGLKI